MNLNRIIGMIVLAMEVGFLSLVVWMATLPPHFVFQYIFMGCCASWVLYFFIRDLVFVIRTWK